MWYTHEKVDVDRHDDYKKDRYNLFAGNYMVTEKPREIENTRQTMENVHIKEKCNRCKRELKIE